MTWHRYRLFRPRHHIRSPLITLAALLSFLLASLTACADTHTTATNHQPLSTVSLQTLIDTAPANTTLLIPPGSYTDILTITKPLHIVGIGTPPPTISTTSDTNSYAIRILAPNITLTNLDITNHGPGLYTSAIHILTPHTTIDTCTIHDTPVGIATWSTTTTITNCTFASCNDEAIGLFGTSTSPCSDTHITKCIFTTNCDGIELQHTNTTTVTSCTFTSNTHSGIDGIGDGNTHLTVTDCTFTHNEGYGLILASTTDVTLDTCNYTQSTLMASATNLACTKCTFDTVTLTDGSTATMTHCQPLDATHLKNQESHYIVTEHLPSVHRLAQVLTMVLSHLRAIKNG